MITGQEGILAFFFSARLSYDNRWITAYWSRLTTCTTKQQSGLFPKPVVKLRDLFVRHAKITVVVIVVVVVARVYAYHPFTATTIFRDLKTFRR